MTDPLPPNLDLIRMVQQARMQHDREVIPSQVSGRYWIESKPLAGGVPGPTERAGEWVIETTAAEVDAVWLKVRLATEAGTLGYKSKVSTAPVKDQADPQARMMVVRTADADDLGEVTRVREVLLALGITPLRYMRISGAV